MLRLWVSDIDGTLMDSHKEIKKADIEAIHSLLSDPVNFCLASGRTYREIQAVMEEVGGLFHAVCQNGASVYDSNGKLLAERFFNGLLAELVYGSISSEQFVKVVCTPEANYVVECNARALEVGKRFLSPLLESAELPARLAYHMRVTKLSIYGEPSELKVLKEWLIERYSTYIQVFFSDRDGIDIMPAGVDKGSGIRILLDSLGIQPEEMACIGDSFNDVAMFKLTPHSYVMKTGHEGVRECAAYEVESVAEAILSGTNGRSEPTVDRAMGAEQV